MPDSVATAIASAPAATPAPPAPPPAAPPSAPPPPAAATPPSAPSAPAAPVNDGTAAPTGPKRLNPKEYANATDAYMAESAWRQENPDGGSPWEESTPAEVTVEKPAEEVQAEAPKAEEVKVEEKAGEPEESYSLDEEPSLTPQALNDLIKGKPEREEFFNSDPELKGQLMKMAREHNELQQFRGIFPGKESAEFAKKTSDRFVTLQAKIQTAETGEAMNSAIDDFAQEFAVTGADGQPVRDADGDIEYQEDFYRFAETFIERWAKATIKDVEKKLQTPNLSERDKVRYEDQKTAAEIALQDIHPSPEANDPDLSEVPEHIRGQVEARLAEAKKIEAQNAEAQGKQGKQAQVAQRQQANKQFFDEIGQRTFNQVSSTIDKMRKSGAAIPEWMLQTNIPGTNTPVFYSQVGTAVQELIQSDPWTRRTMAELEMRPPTPENIQERVKFYDSVLNRTNERGISNIRGIVSKIVKGFGDGLQKQQDSRPAPTTTAAPEPKGGGPVKPTVLTRDQAYHQAQAQLAKEVVGWDDLDHSTKMAYTFTRQNNLMSAKR